MYGKDSEGVPSTILKEHQVGKKDNPVLVICPTYASEKWESEFPKWSSFSVSVYHGADHDLIYDKSEACVVELLWWKTEVK